MKKDYILRNDLAIQNRKYKKIDSYIENEIHVNHYSYKDFLLTDILFLNICSNKYKKFLQNILTKEIKIFLKKFKIKKFDEALIVGLGNQKITCDSLGPLVCDNVVATGAFDMFLNNYRSVYVYKPGVNKETGFMAFNGINALCKELKPKVIIVIDSLVCSHVKYLNKVIQLSDIGIIPGSGIANYNEEISLKTMGIPVLVVGVPTATYASTIIRDAMKEKKNHITFKEGYDFVVATKDVDLLISDLSKIIGIGINNSLNKFNTF